MNLNQYIKPMLFGKELTDKLTQIPNKVDASDMTATERLETLQVLHDLYIPSFMSVEIYTKPHLMLTRSFQRKGTIEAVQQANLNHHHLLKNTMPHLSTGVGSADSMSILGESGIGKSSSIGRAMQLITDELIIVGSPFRKLLPFVKVEVPFDSSIKTVVVDIARTLDAKKSHLANKPRQQGLMKEFLQRLDHPQLGGVKGQRLTAYRLRAMKIKAAMNVGQSYTIKQLKQSTSVDDLASILRHNYYGWFVCVSHGQYSLVESLESE